MELKAGAAYKISHLLLFEHFQDERGYAVATVVKQTVRRWQ